MPSTCGNGPTTRSTTSRTTDVVEGVLVDEGVSQHSPRGDTALHGIRVGDVHRRHAAKVLGTSKVDGLDHTVRFEWSALDAWFEEDEQVFVHPRNPYTRVDALRSTRTVRVELDGVVLAESSSPVLVFETGLPTRYYLNRLDVDYAHLVPSDTVTACPYKGTTSGYWSARHRRATYRDIAWAYDFPTRELLPIAGLIAFYNEKVDIFRRRPPAGAARTHFVLGHELEPDPHRHRDGTDRRARQLGQAGGPWAGEPTWPRPSTGLSTSPV